jgi:hypothetical protein
MMVSPMSILPAAYAFFAARLTIAFIFLLSFFWLFTACARRASNGRRQSTSRRYGHADCRVAFMAVPVTFATFGQRFRRRGQADDDCD